MSLRKSGTGWRMSRGFRPRLEALEPRLCLSVSLPNVAKNVKPAVPTPVETVVVSGNTLTVNDNVAGDMITITDNGSGTVTATLSGNGATATGNTITTIRVNASGGGDTITDTLSAALTESESLTLKLSKGAHNNVTLTYDGITGGKLYLDVDADGGADTINETFGALSNARLYNNTSADDGANIVSESFGALSSSNVYNNTFLSGGANMLTGTVNGSLTASTPTASGSDMYFNALGSGGSNTLDLTVNGDIDAPSLLDANLSGGLGGCGVFGHAKGTGSDKISFTYTGADNGTLGLSLSGSGGNETLAANVTVNAGSTGKLYGAVAVPKQKSTTLPNSLTFNVFDNSATPSSLVKLNAAIYDANTGDTIVNTSNVSLVTKSGGHC